MRLAEGAGGSIAAKGHMSHRMGTPTALIILWKTGIGPD
jgi:hypothetical protein